VPLWNTPSPSIMRVMSRTLFVNLFRSSLLTCLLAPSLSGCNPLYVVEAAYHQGRILLKRQPVDDVLDTHSLTPSESRALSLVPQARRYAEQRGLTVGKAFTSFSPLDNDSLVWVVMGCKPDSFTLKQWWFPIVGTVPYKGFFSKSDALAASERLNGDGYETFVRGAAAFSTLGWFDDPVLTPLLKNPPSVVVNTILHELVHRTVWFPNHTAFNESLANFIGHAETGPFFANQEPRNDGLVADSNRRLRQEITISSLSEELYDLLSIIYKSTATSEEKLAKKREAFIEAAKKARHLGINFPLFDRANNAEFMQFFIYVRHLGLFDALYQGEQRNLRRFIDRIETFRDSIELNRIEESNIFDSFKQFVYMEKPS
jgi:predicted aminopeptidase